MDSRYLKTGRKIIWTALVCGGAAVPRFAAGQDAAKSRPNILLIITDDLKQRYLGFTSDGTTALTPHIDRFAKNGVYFRRAYATSSVCTPSRYSILTGRYASRCGTPEMDTTAADNGMLRVKWQTWIYPDSDNLVQLLKDAGYFTGYVGKCDVFKKRAPEAVPAESDPRDPAIKKVLVENQERLVEDVKQIGFDYAASLAWANPPNNPCKALRGHNIEWEVKGAFDFLDAAEKKDQPFFLCFATTLLHWYDPMIDIRNPDTRRTHMGYLDEPLHVQPSRQSTIERVKAAGLDENVAITTWLDDGVGALLERLDKLGLTENTLIIFFNDNSTDGGKGSCYDIGAHVPMMVSWKGVVTPNVSDALVGNIDIVPTICEAAGVEIPETYAVDGMSLWPYLNGETETVHDELFLEIGNSRAVVTKDNWKYIALRIPYDTTGVPKEQISHMSYRPGDVNGIERETMRIHPSNYWDKDQLYDLNTDREEMQNLWTDPEAGPRRRLMENHLEQLLTTMPGTFPLLPDEKTDDGVATKNTVHFSSAEGYRTGLLQVHPDWSCTGTDVLVDPSGDGAVTNIGKSAFKNMTYNKALPAGAAQYTVSSVFSFEHTGTAVQSGKKAVFAEDVQSGSEQMYLLLFRETTSRYRITFFDQAGGTESVFNSRLISAADLGLSEDSSGPSASGRLKLSMTIMRGTNETDWSVQASLINLDTDRTIADLTGAGFDTSRAFYDGPIKAGFNSRHAVSEADLSPLTLYTFETRSDP